MEIDLDTIRETVLLAEIEGLRVELAIVRQIGIGACDILLERHAEEERRLRTAIPAPELLERAAGDVQYLGMHWDDAVLLRAAAARIRAVQEARGEV